MPRRVFAATVEIDAPPELVWEVLTDLAAYPRWNPFTIEVRSTLRVGDPIDLTVRMSRLGWTVKQRERVSEVRAPERLAWTMKLGSRHLVNAERIQRIERLPSGGSRYTTEDAIAGALAPLVFAIFGTSLEDGFRAMAAALKAEAEQRQRTM